MKFEVDNKQILNAFFLYREEFISLLKDFIKEAEGETHVQLLYLIHKELFKNNTASVLTEIVRMFNNGKTPDDVFMEFDVR